VWLYRAVTSTPTERGLDRVLYFTDAIAAIAITLLILPLVDAVPEAGHDGSTVGDFFSDHHDQLLGFLISFVVIARLWRVHHAIFQHVDAFNRALLNLTLAWAFTIVVLPFPTALISELTVDRLSVAIYIGTMTLSSLTLSAMCVIVTRNQAMNSSVSPLPPSLQRANLVTTFLFVMATFIGSILPRVGLWALLVLLLAGPISVAIDRFRPLRA
jgi:uncharacterized membrane protein